MIEKNQEIVAKLNKYAKLLIESLPKEKSIKLVDFININTGKLNANQADLNGKYPFFTCSENQTYINTYDDKEATLRILVDKLMGRSEFKGVSAVDAFCGLEDTRY